jgi:signal transduction histidine kinase
MNRKLNGLSRQYQAALRKHLKQKAKAGLLTPQVLGRRALALGLETLDLAKIHESALKTLILPGYARATREGLVRRARLFFAEAVTPIENTHRPAIEARVELSQVNRQLRQRSVDLTDSILQLRQQIVQRKAAEECLERSERHYGQLLEQSRQMHEQLRLLSRQVLSAQEEERKKISRELHDVIAQTLTGINVRLGTLKKESVVNTEGLKQNIARTQELVQRSVDIVHRFARELRPTVLDDLGLIPALHTFMKAFREQTGIRVSLSAFAAVEELNGDKRTVLYRVAQEALTNVARHAQASEAEVKIQKLDRSISMKIKDNGKGFHEGRVLHAKKRNRLGLLGMRERLEMVGGKFVVSSTPGQGTIVEAHIPLAANGRNGGKPANGGRYATF